MLNITYWKSREIKCCFFLSIHFHVKPAPYNGKMLMKRANAPNQSACTWLRVPSAFPLADPVIVQLQGELNQSSGSTENKSTKTVCWPKGGRAPGPRPGSWRYGTAVRGLAQRERQEQELLSTAVCSRTRWGATWYSRFFRPQKMSYKHHFVFHLFSFQSWS